MRTGVSYMGHHNPKHMLADIRDLASLRCDDVLLAAQENDFEWMTGKLTFLPKIAKDHGLRPIANFWGALNLFGGGRSSQFLLSNPDGHQVNQDGSWNPAGCYNNPKCVKRITEMIDRIAELGFEGYLIDEPTALECYCPSCRALFAQWYAGDLRAADEATAVAFRRRCVVHYVRTICRYVKANHPRLETQCVLMPQDRAMWADVAAVPELDNLGTDIYWVSLDNPVEEMTPLVQEMAGLCRKHGKIHHEWLEGWAVREGREARMVEQGRILVREQPDALYVWAYEGQIGTTETCDDPLRVWSRVCEILREAKA